MLIHTGVMVILILAMRQFYFADFQNQATCAVLTFYELLERIPIMKERVFRGMPLRRAIKFASRIGCSISKPRRTGEWMIRHYCISKPLRVDARRKDAPISLVSMLLSIENYKA